jgi:uncharacterized membrane protein YqaE (UPF0057 family)
VKKYCWYKTPQFFMGAFAVVNVFMYFVLHKFWIGGSSFLPMIGVMGKSNTFFYAFLVNIGVIIGSFISAITSDEFIFRMPQKKYLFRAVFGGFLIGMGVTLAPGTCTTAFVIGVPMMSVSSFLSIAGIILGAYSVYRISWGKK